MATQPASHNKAGLADPAVEEFVDQLIDRVSGLRISSDEEDEWAQGFNDAVANITKLIGESLMAARAVARGAA